MSGLAFSVCDQFERALVLSSPSSASSHTPIALYRETESFISTISLPTGSDWWRLVTLGISSSVYSCLQLSVPIRSVLAPPEHS